MPSKKSNLQFYADECFPIPSVTHLKSLGYSVVHAFDFKLVKKSDHTHLKKSKSLKRTLLTLDRDFLYYDDVSLKEHTGVIVISAGSTTPPQVNKIYEKFFKKINKDYVKSSLLRVTSNKIVKFKEGKIVSAKIF